MNKEQKNTRRKFLDKGIIGGIGIIAGIEIMNRSVKKDPENKKTTRLISADGTLYDIDNKYIDKMCSGKVSNSRLKEWIEEEKKKNNKS